MHKMDASHRMGIITGTGDRRDDDIKELGRISGRCFDEVIIRQDKNLRGRGAEEIAGLLEEGINEAKTSDIPVHRILNERDAIMHAYNTAKPGSIIFAMCDSVTETINIIKKLKEDEEKNGVKKSFSSLMEA
jgi:cyanophycin synthetase